MNYNISVRVMKEDNFTGIGGLFYNITFNVRYLSMIEFFCLWKLLGEV